MTDKSNSRIKVTRSFIFAITVILLILVSWAGLTKAGYMDNYLGIEMLCSESKTPTQNSESNTSAQTNELFPPDAVWKPVIYLYPKVKTNVLVELNYRGNIIADYPSYNHSINGWEVLAYPDGRLINSSDNKEYSYIFWEGKPSEHANYDLSKGFVVKGSDTKLFLQNKLSVIGLSPKEYNEFIVYWYPLMKDNEYNLIHFASEEYTDTAPLSITPKPDSMLRVFMAYKPLSEFVDIEPQTIKPFERKGFTVIEWGGTEIK